MHHDGIPRVFCWSKMGAESGEDLEAILRRKEVERKANGGTFTWGVGTPLGESMTELISTVANPVVVFTAMRAKPKAIDKSPNNLLLWLTYYDRNGSEHMLPRYSLLTSRGHTETDRRKRSHHALICSSSESLTQYRGNTLNAAELRNLRTGKPVGFSQVTSVVARDEVYTGEEKPYEVGFQANLCGEGQVRLAKAIEISYNDINRAFAAAHVGDVVAWKHEIDRIKNNISYHPSVAASLPQLSIPM